MFNTHISVYNSILAILVLRVTLVIIKSCVNQLLQMVVLKVQD